MRRILYCLIICFLTSKVFIIQHQSCHKNQHGFEKSTLKKIVYIFCFEVKHCSTLYYVVSIGFILPGFLCCLLPVSLLLSVIVGLGSVWTMNQNQTLYLLSTPNLYPNKLTMLYKVLNNIAALKHWSILNSHLLGKP